MSTPLSRCQAWVTDVVVGLDLCPWAAAPLSSGRVRWRSTDATALEELVAEVLFEARVLADAQHIDTSLLVLSSPGATPDFEDLLEVTDIADAVLDDQGLAHAIQLVAFHPAFRYADACATDPANGTNRSPAPMVHLLRRADIAALSVDGAALAERNARVLREAAKES